MSLEVTINQFGFQVFNILKHSKTQNDGLKRRTCIFQGLENYDERN